MPRKLTLATKVGLAAGIAATAAVVFVGVRAANQFAPNDQPVGYVAQPVMSSSNVSDGEAKMYAVDYDASNWSGTVHAYRVSQAGAIESTDMWGTGGAGAKIRNQTSDKRFIATFQPTAAKGVAFRWASLSADQKAALDPGNTGAASPLLDYLRGDASNEGTAAGKFRPRASGLGDIIHSTPVYWKDSNGDATVFVGSNDGMLHAINASTGTERFAYVPNVLLNRLGTLASNAYTHQYLVDGRLDVKQFGSTTVLVGTLGAGGRAVFGLNVTGANTATDDAAASRVLWEVTNKSTGLANLGYTYGAPVLTTLAGNDPTDPSKNAVPALVIGNGYMNEGNGHAVLYVLNPLTGGVLQTHDTGVGTAASPNGLSSPSLWDTDGDGFKDTAYAGDLDGNLWKFDLTGVKSATKLFSAGQAITMAPALMAHPLKGVMVDFVTGRMLTKGDSSNNESHYAYGIWDGAPAGNTSLLEQVLSEKTYKNGTTEVRVRMATDNPPDWTAGKNMGWKTKLPVGGERVVGDGAFVTGKIFQFFSTNPTISPNAIPPGENWWMQINALTGGANLTTVFDLNGDLHFDDQDQVDAADPVGRHMGGGVRSQLISLSAGGIDVYQSNFDRNTAPAVTQVTVPGGETVETSTETVKGSRGVSGGHFDTDVFCYKGCGNRLTYGYATDYSGKPLAGVYSAGRGDDGLNYIHVHEYDDIYDRVGINTRHPSQDRQRLALAAVQSTYTYSPDTPTMKTNNTRPSNATVVSYKETDYTKQSSVPSEARVYTDAEGVETKSVESTVNGVRTVTRTVVYKTTLDETTYTNQVYTSSKKTYSYTRVDARYSWYTTVTAVDRYPARRFKVLMANQAYSPAVKFTIGGAVDKVSGPQATFADKVTKYQTGAKPVAAQLPVYTTVAAVQPTGTPKPPETDPLVLSMPLDAFNVQDWGTGDVRTGVHPIKPQCAGVASHTQTFGPDGEWRNGALTVQIVEETVTDNDIEMNVANRPELGYRLKQTSIPTKLIAEYLIYWHRYEYCMGQTGWTKAPAEDTSESDAIQGAYPQGENDPKGVFVSVKGTTVQVPPDETLAPVVNPDGSTTYTTVHYEPLADGGYTKTVTKKTVTPATTIGGTGSASSGSIVTGGAVSPTSIIDVGGVTTKASSLGRINWRELQQ